MAKDLVKKLLLGSSLLAATACSSYRDTNADDNLEGRTRTHKGIKHITGTVTPEAGGPTYWLSKEKGKYVVGRDRIVEDYWGGDTKESYVLGGDKDPIEYGTSNPMALTPVDARNYKFIIASEDSTEREIVDIPEIKIGLPGRKTLSPFSQITHEDMPYNLFTMDLGDGEEEVYVAKTKIPVAGVASGNLLVIRDGRPMPHFGKTMKVEGRAYMLVEAKPYVEPQIKLPEEVAPRVELEIPVLELPGAQAPKTYDPLNPRKDPLMPEIDPKK